MPYKKNYRPFKSNYSSYAGKKKWAPLMRDIPKTMFSIQPTATDGTFATLVSNSNETSNPTPTILKVKHVKASIDVSVNATALHNGFACIMYCPQGITPSAGMPVIHPEWILSWRNLTNDVSATHHNHMLSSSMCRNLNSGDSIILMITYYNDAVSPTTFYFSSRFSCVVRNN